MASPSLRFKTVVLLLFIHCLLLLTLFVGSCIVVQYFVFFASEESTGCIICIVFMILCSCSVPPLHGGLGWTFHVHNHLRIDCIGQHGFVFL